MATTVPLKAKQETINGQAAMALALLSAWEEKHTCEDCGPTLEDVSLRILTLLSGNITVHDLGLRKVPGGVYSDEVETFVGHLLAEGLATHRSPIRLRPQGEKLLGTIIRVESKEHAEAVQRAAGLLNLDTSELLAGVI
jgi:hypothetical protein